MGYTTKFSGAINLSRKLTMAEAKQLLEWSDNPDVISAPKPESYMQWVPSVSLDSIGWDGEEKFYNYTAWMAWVCEWLKSIGIAANGSLRWSGESAGDTGELIVSDNSVSERATPKKSAAFKPLTLRGLADMALEQATKPA